MLDYIGGDIECIKETRSGHKVALCHRRTKDGEAVTQRFEVRGPSPGLIGDRLVVMLLEDEVAGWHNQATGEQGHLLQFLPNIRCRIRDALVALAAALVPNLTGNALLGWAAGLGWLVATALWRLHSIRRAGAELIEALQLAEGVTSRAKDRTP